MGTLAEMRPDSNGGVVVHTSMRRCFAWSGALPLMAAAAHLGQTRFEIGTRPVWRIVYADCRSAKLDYAHAAMIEDRRARKISPAYFSVCSKPAPEFAIRRHTQAPGTGPGWGSSVNP